MADTTIGEEWRPIPGFEGRYSVSSMGRVKTHCKYGGMVNQLRKISTNKQGYQSVWLHSVGVCGGTSCKIHHLVLLAFGVARPSDRHEANHKNGKRNDNRLCNLEWVSHSENMRHSYRSNGRVPNHGTRSGNAKVTDDQVCDIRKMRAEGHTLISIANKYGIGRANVGHICLGRTWKHLPLSK
jgi:hypothetical protein